MTGEMRYYLSGCFHVPYETFHVISPLWITLYSLHDGAQYHVSLPHVPNHAQNHAHDPS